MEISKVGVVGCGLMGHGIAQICAQAGWDVVVREVSQEKLDGGIGKIEKQLARAVEKGKAEQSEADAVRARIQPTLDYSDLADCDLVIEAITEDLGAEARDVEARWTGCQGRTPTSPPTPPRCRSPIRPRRPPGRSGSSGLHFFNPAQVMPLLEVVRADGHRRRGGASSASSSGEKLGKTTVAAQDNRRVHRQPAAGPLHAGRDPRLRGGRRLDRGHRRGDDGGRHSPDGAADAGRLRRAGHAWRRSPT